MLEVYSHYLFFDCSQKHFDVNELSFFSIAAGGGGGGGGASLPQSRFQSSYVGSFARRVRDREEVNEVAHLRELFRRNDPESVIRIFESSPSMHSNASALTEYIKALVKVDRLDQSELVRTLQRGG